MKYKVKCVHRPRKHLKSRRAPQKKGTSNNGQYISIFYAFYPLLQFKKMLRAVRFSIFVYFEKVVNVLNMATCVNNCIIQGQKGHYPNGKRAHFLVFYKSEGAPSPSDQ